MIVHRLKVSAALWLIFPSIGIAADTPGQSSNDRNGITIALPATPPTPTVVDIGRTDIATLMAAARAMPTPDDKCLNNGSKGKGQALGHCKGLSPD